MDRDIRTAAEAEAGVSECVCLYVFADEDGLSEATLLNPSCQNTKAYALSHLSHHSKLPGMMLRHCCRLRWVGHFV